MEVRCNCFTKGYIFIALQVLRSVSCSCLGSQPCRPKQYYWCLSAELTGKTTKAKEQTQKAIHKETNDTKQNQTQTSEVNPQNIMKGKHVKKKSSKESSDKMVSEKAAGLPHMGSLCNMYPLLSYIWLGHTCDMQCKSSHEPLYFC